MYKIGMTLGMLFSMLNTSSTVTAYDREQSVKAVYIYNFFNYVTWPNRQNSDHKPSAVLCIYGRDPFGDALIYIKEKMTDQLELQIKHIDELDAIPSCHILFVGSLTEKDTTHFGENFNHPEVLTVSDVPGFADEIGIIELKKNDRQLKLIINAQRLEDSGLKVSSKLMKIATIRQRVK